MINCDRFKSGSNCLICVEACLVHEVVEALAVELSLDFREDCFDWVELRRVTDVPDWLHVQLRPPLFDARFLMDVQIVHEEGDRLAPDLLAELFEVVAEILTGARLIMDLDQPNPVFFHHGCNH